MTSEPPERKRFAVPAYQFDDGDDEIHPRLASADADEYVEVWYDDVPASGPNVRCKHVQGDEQTYYDLRITDQALRWCRYKGGDPGDLPPAVRHAVGAFGYGLEDQTTKCRDLASVAILMQLTRRLNEIRSDFAEMPLYDGCLEEVIGLLHTISKVPFGRAVLDEETFEAACEPDDLSEVAHRLDEALQASEWESYLASDEWNAGLEWWVRNGSHGPVIQMDLYVGPDVCRFQFQRESEHRCALQRPANAAVPPQIVERLQEAGMAVANVDSVVNANSPQDVTQRTFQFVSELGDDPAFAPVLAPHTREGTAADVPAIMDLLMQAYAIDPEVVTTEHNRVCDRFGIEPDDEIDVQTHAVVIPMFLKALSESTRSELRAFVSDHLDHSNASEQDDGMIDIRLKAIPE